MAERELAGKNFLLYRGNGEESNETFDLIACLTNNAISQTSSTVTTETKCGTVTVPGSQSATATFSHIPRLSPAANIVAMETLQDDYKLGRVNNWKATTATPVTGDPIMSFRGFISDLGWAAGVGDPLTGDGTIQINADGMDLTIVP